MMVAGVAGGLGEYFEIDPVIIRLGFLLLTFAGGSGPLLYLILWLIVPKRSSQDLNGENRVKEVTEEIKEKAEVIKTEIEGNNRANKVVALGLIGLGVILLVNQVVPLAWMTSKFLWPAALIGVGVYLIFKQ